MRTTGLRHSPTAISSASASSVSRNRWNRFRWCISLAKYSDEVGFHAPDLLALATPTIPTPTSNAGGAPQSRIEVGIAKLLGSFEKESISGTSAEGRVEGRMSTSQRKVGSGLR